MDVLDTLLQFVLKNIHWLLICVFFTQEEQEAIDFNLIKTIR